MVLGRFPDLAHLKLPASYELDLGWDGGSWCGNAYFGYGGRKAGRAKVRRGVEATELAAGIVLDALPRLQSLSIGSACANISWSEEDGHIDGVSWKWTGRVEEYAREIYPVFAVDPAGYY